MEYYIATLVVFLLINIMAALGLDLQFGVAGTLSFAYIVFQAVGAYTAAILTLGPDTGNGGFQQYIGGSRLPFPLPLICGTLVAGIVALAVGAICLRRVRRDYQAMIMLVISVIATAMAENATSVVNGINGLSLVPQPLKWFSHVGTTDSIWGYAALCVIPLILTYFVVYRITESPWGRSLRAARDNEPAVAALGKNVARMQLTAFIVGGMIAGASGALLVQFIGAWAPAGWLYPETFVYVTAIIVGGRANRRGVVFGTFLVATVIGEASTYLPAFGPTPVFVSSMDWIVAGVLVLIFLWFRPQGAFPEPVRQLSKRLGLVGERLEGGPVGGDAFARSPGGAIRPSG